MEDVKSFWKSRTLRGAAVSVASQVAVVAGVAVSPDVVADVVKLAFETGDAVAAARAGGWVAAAPAVGTLVGAWMTVTGRLRASTRIGK